MELTKPAKWDYMSQAAKKIMEKEAGEAQGEYAPLSPKKHYGGRLPACAARACIAAQTGAHRGICRQRSSNEAAESRQGTAGNIEKPRK